MDWQRAPKKSDSGRNYYDILEVPKNSSQDDLKKAYRRAAMKHHPDKGGDVEKFKELGHAYKVLSDPQQRVIYDRDGEDQFGEDMYGEDRYGKDQYNEDQYGEYKYSQNRYGQDWYWYGSNQYGQDWYGNRYDQGWYGQNRYGKEKYSKDRDQTGEQRDVVRLTACLDKMKYLPNNISY
ncbi:chaperone protein dnaJ A6-like [Rosa rugosa]|uniref:chaperone protein dnaJ A6-like n=1 Tax=Rosa rugosa TaxID=74645 RepID=UPI002B411C38|nr:chaperone protein dnaJ A6-like [Rosa rugosa]